MVNIIYDLSSIRLTQFNANETYGLEELRFFIPTSKPLLSLFCIIKNSNGNLDSVKLTQTASESKNYNCYMFSQKQEISVPSGELTFFIFGICEDKTTFIPEEFKMNINVENYNISTQIYLLNQISRETANYYNKIVELTKQNINILSDMHDLKGGESI